MNLTTNYFKIPNNIFELGLTTYEFVVTTYLLRLENNNSQSFPSYKTIAEKCNISERTAKNVVKSLVGLGLLSKVVRKTKDKKCNDTNVYKVANLIETGVATMEVVDGKEIKKIVNESDLNKEIEQIEDTQDLLLEEKDAEETEELIRAFYAGEVSVQEQTEEQDLKEKIEIFQTHLNRQVSHNLRDIIADLDWSEIVDADMQINSSKKDTYVTESYVINAIYDNKKKPSLKLVK